ncbi:MAG: helix-turn-helix transcriptional regulator [Streptosporangiaceae bacterium]|jgi:transcriptional regulator with XRE-family HTH domain
MTDTELGGLLRQARESLAPAAAGLPAGPRRRAKGLRRAEVAMLAGVSVEYLTRLEQGRDRHPSPQVLAALADALQLTMSQRSRLYYLAKTATAGFNCRGNVPLSTTVRPTVQALLDGLEPAPAVLLNRLSDILACTTGYQRLMPAGLLEDGNLARYVFTDPGAREFFPDWEHVADEQVAVIKRGPFRADPHVAAFTGELTVSAGDEFTRRVAAVPGLPKPSGVIRVLHPRAGSLRLSYETLELSDDDQRLVVHLPADETTAAALGRLARRRPLGLVSG